MNPKSSQQKQSGVRIVGTIFLSFVVSLFFFRVLNMNTPGWWITSWRASLVPHPSIWAIFLISFAVDSALCFSAIWGAQSLWRQVGEATRVGEFESSPPKRIRRHGATIAGILCSIPFSLYTTCAAVGIFGDRLGRSPTRLATCVLLTFGFFLSVIYGGYVLVSQSDQQSNAGS
jgi:hypothetical protein